MEWTPPKASSDGEKAGPERRRPWPRGVFFVFEGIDGAGKTTQALLLKGRLEEEGLEAVYVKEPTSGVWGQKIKNIARHGRQGISPEEELNYFIRDRAEDVRDNIGPALKQNKVVVGDRYFYSTIAYQAALGLDPEEIRQKNAAFPVPDLVFLLEISPELSQVRINNLRRSAANLGYEQEEYLRLVKKNFEALTDPNLVRLDGEQEIEAVAAEVWARAAGLVLGR